MKKVVLTQQAPAPIGPYSQAIEINNMLFISGQVAIDPARGNFAENRGIAEETKQVMENIQAILTVSGYSMANIVKCTVFILDMKKFSEMNAVYGDYFPVDPPSRETVAVAGLPRNAQVEISAIAVKPH